MFTRKPGRECLSQLCSSSPESEDGPHPSPGEATSQPRWSTQSTQRQDRVIDSKKESTQLLGCTSEALCSVTASRLERPRAIDSTSVDTLEKGKRATDRRWPSAGGGTDHKGTEKGIAGGGG